MRRRTAWLAVAIFAAALVPRLWAAHALAPLPVWDGFYYDIGARSISQGLGYVGETGKPWCHYPVGYPALLGGVYAIFGSAPIVGKLLGAALGALLAAFVYLLAARATSERRAVVAGLLVAVHPGLVAYAALHMTEILSALLLVAAALVAGPKKRAAAAGLVLGLATLVRPQSILLAPLVGLFGPRRFGPMLRAGAVATALAAAVVIPWTIRNCRVMDGCAFVSTNGGWNLAIGSFPRATGRFETLRAGDGCHIVTGQVQQDRCWMRLGWGWIAEDPARWLAMMPKKLSFTFDHESFPIGYLAEADPEGWPEARRAVGRGLLSWSHRLLLTVAALAMLPTPSRQRPRSLLAPFALLFYATFAAMTPPHPFWPLALAICLAAVVRWRRLSAPALYTAALVATLVGVHAVFFGEDRYHLVATPLLCLVAATFGQPLRSEGSEPVTDS
jgi:4-amino-4-deoxy-L-arabinose transferase-like glycosyltransferase